MQYILLTCYCCQVEPTSRRVEVPITFEGVGEGETVDYKYEDCENDRYLNHGCQSRMVVLVAKFLPRLVAEQQLYRITRVDNEHRGNGEQDEHKVDPDFDESALE